MANVQFLSIRTVGSNTCTFAKDMLRRHFNNPMMALSKVLQKKDKVFSLTSMSKRSICIYLIDANLPSFLTLRTCNYLKPRMKHLLLWNLTTSAPATVESDPTASTPTQPSTFWS
ncbi:hypothetical protein TNCV_4707801 [Trichonephila clavipes]|nr:hypothetical protein TNCV_4707801 [Trichonephila clavipes]